MEHDPVLKGLLKAFFAEFLRLFYREKAARLDLSTVVFLDKEVFTDVPRGRERRLDLVAEVRTKEGEPELILVHVELEAAWRRGFEARMFDYYMALRLRYGRPVFPIALALTRTPGGLDRPVHRERVLGDEVCAFRFWRVGLARLPGAEYIDLENPLAPALAAVMSPGGAARLQWRLACLRRVAQKRLDEARRALLLDFVETYLPLSGREKARFERLIERPENREVRAMRKSWSEQISEQAEKRGVKLGQKLGQRLGQKLGQKLGEERGVKRAKRETLLVQMKAKFGPLPPAVVRAVSRIEQVRRLDALLRRVLTATTVAEMGLTR